MDKKDIQSIVLANRYRLISEFNFSCKDTAANCAYKLTQNAISKKYIEPRDSVRGETLRKWAKDKNPPQWACRSAADLLVSINYDFRNKEDIFLAVYFFLLNNEFDSAEMAIGKLPSFLNDEYCQGLVDTFFNAGVLQ